MITTPGEEGQQLRILIQRARKIYEAQLKEIKEHNRIAFWQPSYEQCLLLNAWLFGVDFPIVFAANRIGKTVALIVNAILHIYPNNPQWRMFQPHVDEYGQLCQVIQRPALKNLRKIQRLLRQQSDKIPTMDPRYPTKATNQPSPDHDPRRQEQSRENEKAIATLQQLRPDLFKPAYPSPPLQEGGQIWIGAPDAGFQRNIIFKRWKHLIPTASVLSWSDNKMEFQITTQDQLNPTPTIQHIIGKSYEAEDTKWSGDAVHGIVLTEGFTQSILNEVKNRLAEPAFASWDYTPYEPRNSGARTALAYRVLKGDEELPLKPYVFRKFSVRNAPSYIIPAEKRQDMIRMWENKPEGKARLDGDFFASSGLILGSLDRNHHCLDWTFDELLTKRPRHQLYRGMDPGLDHPTACWWALLDDTNTWFFYRCYSKRATTIPERCNDIITLSNNEAHKEQYGKGKDDYKIQEIHTRHNSEVFAATVIDNKMFKNDETTGQNYSLHYVKNGLNVIPSTTEGPENRALQADSLLDPKNHRFHPHPETNRPPGSRIYFLINGFGVAAALQQFDQLFWDRYRSGDYVGQPKDKVPLHGDDELDALCNLVCGPFSFTGYSGYRVVPLDPITHAPGPRNEEPEYVMQ